MGSLKPSRTFVPAGMLPSCAMPASGGPMPPELSLPHCKYGSALLEQHGICFAALHQAVRHRSLNLEVPRTCGAVFRPRTAATHHHGHELETMRLSCRDGVRPGIDAPRVPPVRTLEDGQVVAGVPGAYPALGDRVQRHDLRWRRGGSRGRRWRQCRPRRTDPHTEAAVVERDLLLSALEYGCQEASQLCAVHSATEGCVLGSCSCSKETHCCKQHNRVLSRTHILVCCLVVMIWADSQTHILQGTFILCLYM